MDSLEFVQIIEAELKARNIKKEKFYKESGISSATMSQWRKRIYSPSPDNIRKVESYLGISFGFAQKNKPAPMSESELDAALIKMLVDLSAEELGQVVAFVQGLKAARKV